MVVFGGKLVGSRLGWGALAASAWVLLDSRVAEACSCLPSTVESSYEQSSDVATVIPLLSYRHGAERWYLAKVSEVYKGCVEAKDLVLLSTPSSSASCGGQLEIGVEYLVNAQRSGSVLGVPKLAFGSCDYNLPTGELDTHDREFLAGRSVCCGEEYGENGYAVCQASGCSTDADCAEGEWCRQAPESEPGELANECVRFVAAGDSCEGFTLPWFFERCAPGLVCDTPDFVADAPGSCRAPCTSLADCPEGEYCASDGTCDSDGQCEITADCTLEGNTFVAPLCVGYPTCDAPSGCGWACGDPACMDGWGYDFGPCDAVLGFGMFGGACTTIRGCDAGPFPLFESERACRDACEPEPPPECSSDADCARTGCSGQVCAAEPVFTTCEYRDEYACFQDPAVTACGCDAGRCGFDQTPELAACLDAAGAPALPR